MNAPRKAFDLVFVAGAARTGTTLLHALVCTSPQANEYIGECSYLTALAWSYLTGLQHFDIHARYYYASLADYFTHHGRLLDTVVTDHWDHLGRPRVLALKDPNLTRLIPLLAQWFPDAKFSVAFRDPRDVVASRVQVQKRKNPGIDALARGNILTLAHEYRADYQALEAAYPALADRLLYVEYESLVRGNVAKLGGFLGLDDLDPATLWQRSQVDEAAYRGNEWNSALYYKPISDEAVGSYEQILDPESAAAVMGECTGIWSQLMRRAS